jgi:putative endonuclease
MNNNWCVYILLCSDDTLYTGITNNLLKRLETHNKGKGAKYTKQRLPVKLLYYEEVLNRSLASKREYEIKKLSRAEKLIEIAKKI